MMCTSNDDVIILNRVSGVFMSTLNMLRRTLMNNSLT
jgi:hypothetical protein